tara:strand:+ start:111 stop:518 length:408 start_codon:yes stop_codon:yes gene_type:complete
MEHTPTQNETPLHTLTVLSNQQIEEIIETAWPWSMTPGYWMIDFAAGHDDIVRFAQTDDYALIFCEVDEERNPVKDHEITRPEFIRAIDRGLRAEKEGDRRATKAALADVLNGHLDGIGADVLVQIALFGEVVYG